ncbi:glutathione S-transferase family protein [Corynebacterium hindlerae]|uniref:glutathione S-transferase family protein n=1 Tax=Corynebacterium hindlerae TaxID=699041 RepID=UPI0031B7191B
MTDDWAGPARNASPDGEYIRDTNYITDRIVSSVSEVTEQPDGTFHWPVEAGRYRLMAARACPWAHRTIISRRLLGLEDVISLSLAAPTHDVRSWNYDLDPGGVDPVLGIRRLQEAYFNRFPDYPRGITVPAIVDIATKQVVTNDYPSITLDFATEWTAFHREGAPDLYPEPLRREIDEINARVFREVNNGVYRCGFAGSQEAYEEAHAQLFDALDWLEDHLSTRRYLLGDHITEADIRLYPTLIRFDVCYYSHFKCSRNRIKDMPNLWGYLRDLYQTPGFGDTTDLQQVKEHYFITHAEINPTQIVPVGPDMSELMSPHGRERLGGSPFAPGDTPPAS